MKKDIILFNLCTLTLVVPLSAINPLIAPIISGILTSGIDFLIGSSAAPPVADLSAQSIQEISKAVNAAVSQTSLNEYVSDANALIGSITYYKRSNQTMYEQTVTCGDSIANYDSNRIRQYMEHAEEVSTLLSSRSDFGFTIIPTYTLVTSIHLALIREQIVIKKTLVDVYQDNEDVKNSYQDEVKQFQEKLHNTALLHKTRLVDQFKPRINVYSKRLFKLKVTKKGKCRGGKRVYRFNIFKNGNFLKVYSRCKNCSLSSTTCKSAAAAANRGMDILASQEAKKILDQYAPDFNDFIETLEDIINTPIEDL
jgi:hypothetical protein